MVVDEHDGWGSAGLLAVQAFWPTLWGRALRDVIYAGKIEIDLARWAMQNLRVEGWHPAIRVGTQPYGLLATTAFESWVPDVGNEHAELEERIRRWGIAWRRGAAAAARDADVRVHGADTDRLLEVLGMHAPSRQWRVRPTADLHIIQAARALAGNGADAGNRVGHRHRRQLPRSAAYPDHPIGPAARPGQVPGPPGDMVEDVDDLLDLCFKHPEPLYFERGRDRGLVGHLFREVMIAQRAIVGEAIIRFRAGDPVELDQPLPLDDEGAYQRLRHGRRRVIARGARGQHRRQRRPARLPLRPGARGARNDALSVVAEAGLVVPRRARRARHRRVPCRPLADRHRRAAPRRGWSTPAPRSASAPTAGSTRPLPTWGSTAARSLPGRPRPGSCTRRPMRRRSPRRCCATLRFATRATTAGT